MNPFAELAAALDNFLIGIPAEDLYRIFWGAPRKELEKALEFYESRECYTHCAAIKQLIDWETWTYSPTF